jgi:hypothetical protein
MKQDIGGSAAARRLPPARKFALLCISGAAIFGLTAAMAAAPQDPASQASSAATPTSANWAPRKLHFSYVGFTARYSCDGLRDQVKKILQQLGAGDDLVVKSSGCVRLEGPEAFPGVDATFSVLEEAASGAGGAANSKSVAARWDAVTLDSDTTGRTGAGGCELIEQVKKSVLPLFTTRNLKYSSDCFPHSESLAGARLNVEVLRAVKAPPAAPAP